MTKSASMRASRKSWSSDLRVSPALVAGFFVYGVAVIIWHIGHPEDTPYTARFREIVGTHNIKVSYNSVASVQTIKLMADRNNVDAIICTNPDCLAFLLGTLIDFRHPVNKRGGKKNLTLGDYAGSFFPMKLPSGKVIHVLIAPPLANLVKTPEGPFILKRYVSKITAPQKWFPQTSFSWELYEPRKADALLARFAAAKLLAVDIETYRDDPLRRIDCVGYCGLFPDGSTHTIVVPIRDMISWDFMRKMNASAPGKIFQNGRYDNLYFLRWGAPVHNYLWDTLNLFHCWYSELPKDLGFITAFMVREIRFWKDDASSGNEYDKFEYNARDCWATMNSFLALILELPEYARENYKIEFPLQFPTIHCSADGLALDKQQFLVEKQRAEVELAKREEFLQKAIHPEYNPRSPDQSKRLLQVLGMPNVESSDEKTMNACAAAHPLNARIIKEVIAYREQAKLLSTYFVWDKFWLDRLFYDLNPAGTDTGRLASKESSFWCGLQIQNIPQGRAVKSWIMADPGWDGLGEGDYAQSEARCVGYMSGCEALIKLVESDKDYHSWNASAFFGVPYESVNKALRTLAKRVNHGANYNMGARVLLDTMGPSAVLEAQTLLKLPSKWSMVMVCEHLLKTYERTYPEVKKDWYDALKRSIKFTKKLVSALGWTRVFFNDPTASKPALNAAVAHGPQNLSVGIINEVFYNIWRDSVYGDLRMRLRVKAQIHDSIFFSYRGEDVPGIVQERMKNPKTIVDVKGSARTMLIPPDMSAGKKYWADLK